MSSPAEDGSTSAPPHRRQPRAFAPEAHLPAERRLIVDGSGLTLDTRFGVRHVVPWANAEAVLCWPDRAEILLSPDTSILIRATDWHLGDQAIQAIMECAPTTLTIALPEDPEPVPETYVLHGLARASGVILGLLIFSTALIAVLGFEISLTDRRWQAAATAVPFALGAAYAGAALYRRLRVPARWREVAARRGRLAVRIDSTIARSGATGLWIGLVAVSAAAVGVIAIPMATGRPPNGLLAGLCLAVDAAVIRELRRRGHR